MRKVKHKLAIYGKMYGHTLPTAEKMENAGAVADMVTVAYNTGVIDAKENTNRLADLEKIVIDGYNTPGEFQNWLVDSIRKAYKIGYEERRKEKSISLSRTWYIRDCKLTVNISDSTKGSAIHQY